MAADKTPMQWVERMGLSDFSPIEKVYSVLEVPVGAEFIGVQHDATILVMLIRDRFGSKPPGLGNRNLEERTVVRVSDRMMFEEKGTRYIGGDNKWHLFEVTGRKKKT